MRLAVCKREVAGVGFCCGSFAKRSRQDSERMSGGSVTPVGACPAPRHDLFVKFLRRKHFHEEYVKKLPEGGGWLLAEFGADDDQAADMADRLVRDFKAEGHPAELLRDPAEQAKLWRVRKDGLPATAKLPEWPETYEGWEDSAVPRENLGGYLREFKALLHAHGHESSVYGHFGDGLVHCRIDFDLRTEEGLQNWQSFLEEAADLVVRYGGSLSG
jgi:FAD/FMN-containing dehydrogenase